MARVALDLGTYTDRSVIANCQRCLNLFPRANPAQRPVPFTFYPTPGLIQLGTPPAPAIGRGVYRATNDVLYAVVGQVLYQITAAWAFTALGTLLTPATTPVSMADNGTTLVLVDGSGYGYTVGLYTGVFGQINDPAFYGADRVDFVDTFFVFNKPNTGIFYTSLAISTSFDPLYFATKIGFADKLVSIIVVHREIWLIGESTTEIWVNSGATDFPFQIMTGCFVAHGCAAKYSVAAMGEACFWLSQDLQGHAIVVKGSGYQAARVSTHAIETAISRYATVSDAVGYTYQQEGHQFYVLNFPTADATWVYDLTTDLWHERCFLDVNGVEHRHRGMSAAYAYGANVCQDWQTGALYQFDLDTYNDAGNTIVRRRGFPHMGSDGKRVSYSQFIADMAVGNASGTGVSATRDQALVGLDNTVDAVGLDGLTNTAIGTEQGAVAVLPEPPLVWLRWSDTRGASWSNPVAADLGGGGNYLRSIQFQRLGMARDRVFELFWSYPVKTALNGAFVETKVAQS